MLTVQNTPHFRIERPTIVTIGTFDGVHLGHQKILSRLQQLKKSKGLNTVVLTFEPHPRKILFPSQSDLKLITLIDEKLALLENYGVDVTVVYPFDRSFAAIEPRTYISEVLVKSLKVQHLVIGYDHKFGKNRSGDIRVLQQYAPEFGYEVEETDAMDIDHIAVSSSRIRHALEEGNIELANNYLGHYYSLSGKVISGKKLGRTLGFPTANLQIASSDKLIPKNGIYFAEVVLGSQKYYGMLSIGYNPTTDQDNALKVEVHILDFDGDIYGGQLQVNFIKYLRPEAKFRDLQELTEALKEDKRQCLELIRQQEQIICRL